MPPRARNVRSLLAAAVLVAAAGACKGCGDGAGATPAVGECNLTAAWSQPVDIGRIQPTDPVPGECPEGLPDGRIRIDSVDTFAENAGSYTTVLNVTSLDLTPACKARIKISLLNARVNLDVGTELKVGALVSRRADDRDVTTTWVFRDLDGHVLFATDQGTRPEVFATSLFPDTQLSIDSAPVCKLKGEATMVKARIATSDGECSATPGTLTCCRLWGRQYEVLLSYAYRSPKEPIPTILVYEIRAPGVVAPVSGQSGARPCAGS